MDKTLSSLQLARVIEEDSDGRQRWVGGDTTVVQLGDVLDRGNVEIGILRLLIDLDEQARKEGGAVYMLNGNHGASCFAALRGGWRVWWWALAAVCFFDGRRCCGFSAACVDAALAATTDSKPPNPTTSTPAPPQRPRSPLSNNITFNNIPQPESLNVCGDFRYVTPGAFIESAVEFGIPRDVALRNWDGCIQARAALYLPGGKVARMLSRNPTVLIVNDTAFAHGGLLPNHGALRAGWCRVGVGREQLVVVVVVVVVVC